LLHHEVLEVLGRGGMGVVLKAHDEKLQRIVALKVLAPPFAADPTARQRFVCEARAAAGIRHQNVVDIHAVEEADGLPFLVMEYLTGGTLHERIERGSLPIEEMLRIGHQAAEGLAAAHARGLIHRDVKPSNILLADGVVKLTDFGLARTIDDIRISQEGVVVGTPKYMSPEQARGEAIDARSDLFSLGSVLSDFVRQGDGRSVTARSGSAPRTEARARWSTKCLASASCHAGGVGRCLPVAVECRRGLTTGDGQSRAGGGQPREQTGIHAWGSGGRCAAGPRSRTSGSMIRARMSPSDSGMQTREN
jgi:serine/threonine protein kinase